MDVASPVLVGRAAERALLDAAARREPGSEPCTVFVVGEGGVGKSRLVHTVAADLRQTGTAVFTGRAVDTGTPMAYRPLAEALLAAVRRGHDPAAVGAAGRALLHRFAPGTVAGDVPAPAPAAVAESPVAVAEALLRVLLDVARDVPAGVVLVLEDLHWADADTLAAVEYLADNRHGLPVSLIATFRPEATALRQRARALSARGSARVVELARLGRSETVAMAEACLGGAPVPDDVARLLGRFSEGLPLLVEELLATLVERGTLTADDGHLIVTGPLVPVAPGSIRDAVAERLEALPPSQRDVVATAALLGRDFDWRVLADATGASPAELDAALSAAVAVRLLDPGDGRQTDRFSFHHALTREAVLAALTAPARAALARRSLDALEATRPPTGELLGIAADLAEHAGQAERAAVLLRRAAADALGHGALADAIRWLERAAATAPTATATATAVARDRLHALALAGRAVEAFALADTLLPAHDDAELRSWLALAAAVGTDWRRADQELAAALAHDPDPRLRAGLHALAARIALGRFAVDEADVAAAAALATAEALGLHDVACEALEALGRCARTRDLEEAEALFERQRALARREGLSLLEVRALHELGTVDFLRLRSTERLRAAGARADELGAVGIAALCRFHENLTRFFQFDCDGLRESSEELVATARRHGLGQLVPATLLLVAQTCMLARDVDAMEAAIGEAQALAQDDPERMIVIRAMRGLSALCDEDRATAIDWFDRGVRLSLDHRFAGPGMYHGMWALLASAAGDDSGPAMLRERTSSTLTPLNRGLLDHADAVSAGRAGRTDEAAALARQGDALLAPAPWLRRMARRVVAERAVEDGWGEPVPWLRDADEFFSAIGYDRVAGACQALLRRAGAPPARRAAVDSVPPALAALGVTAREADVLGVLARGCSNREIAERLYLSVRTVEKHVERLLAKTATASRAQLIAWAAKQA